MARIAENTVIVDGQEYKPGDVIPDFKSIRCVDTREPRKYQGLSADVSVLNDVIAKYASGGASCFMSDTGEYYEYDREEKTWKLITNITERGFGSEKAYGALKHMLKNVTVSDEKIQSAVTNYLTVNPVLPGATTEQAWQIEQNKTDVAALKEETGSLKEDITSKADKTALAQTDRKLDALWKLNQGISYEFQTDNTEAYQKTIPSGAKMVSIKSIGGKTIVWNQYSKELGTETGWAYLPVNTSYYKELNEHVVYIKYKTIVKEIKKQVESYKRRFLVLSSETDGRIEIGSEEVRASIFAIGRTMETKEIRTMPKNITGIFAYNYGDDKNGSSAICDTWINIFDLTKMFGAGNEPSTPKEFEAMFPVDYYPYNAGELMSAPVNEVTEQGKNLLGGKAFADKIVELGGTLDEANGKVSIAASVISDKTVFEFPDESKSYTIILSGENTNTNLQSTNLKTDKGACNRFVDRCSITTVTGVKKIFGAYDTQIVIYDYEKCGIFEGVLTADDFKPYHKTSYPIPQAVLNLPGYGWSTGNVRNEVDFENKKYIQRVGKYVITDSETFMTTYAPVITFLNKRHLIKRSVKAINNQGLSIFSANEKGDIWQFLISDIGLDEDATVDDIKEWFKVHPVTSYYPMLNEEITDISDIIGNTFQEPLEVEAGGTLTFRNSHGDDYRIPVPNSEEYVISLAEVAK